MDEKRLAVSGQLGLYSSIPCEALATLVPSCHIDDMLNAKNLRKTASAKYVRRNMQGGL